MSNNVQGNPNAEPAVYHDIDDAADAILSSWIDAEEEQPSKDTLEQTEEEEVLKDQEPDTSLNDDEEDQEKEEVDNEEGEETDLEEEETEDSEEDTEEVVNEAVLTDETMIDIIVDGETKQASVKDLKRLYGQEASLTRKSQETANARKAAEEATNQAQVRYQKMLERAQERWKPYSEVDMLVASKQLSNEDFAQLRQEARIAEEDLKFVTEESNKFYSEIKEQQTIQHKAQAQECIKVLQQDITDWSNDLYNDIRSYAVSQGLRSDDVDQYVDPTVIKLLNKARLYDQTKSVAAKKKAKKAPVKVLRSKKSPPTAKDDRATREAANLKKLRETQGLRGDLDDISAVILDRWRT